MGTASVGYLEEIVVLPTWRYTRVFACLVCADNATNYGAGCQRRKHDGIVHQSVDRRPKGHVALHIFAWPVVLTGWRLPWATVLRGVQQEASNWMMRWVWGGGVAEVECSMISLLTARAELCIHVSVNVLSRTWAFVEVMECLCLQCLLVNFIYYSCTNMRTCLLWHCIMQLRQLISRWLPVAKAFAIQQWVHVCFDTVSCTLDKLQLLSCTRSVSSARHWCTVMGNMLLQ